MKTGLSFKGVLNLQVYENGKLIEETEQENVITSVGMSMLLASFFTIETGVYRVSNKVTRIAFGTGSGQSGDPGKNTFTNPTLKNLTNVSQYPDAPISPGILSSNVIECFFTLGADEGNGKTIREIGLWMTSGLIANENGQWIPNTDPGSADVAFNRIVRAPIVKTSAISLQGSWKIYAQILT